MICTSIGCASHDELIGEHRALADRGAELVELRLDFLSGLPDLNRLLQDRPTPVVITCRRPADGGHWRFSDEQRLDLLRAAIDAGVEYVDLEKDVASQIARSGTTKRIVSHHDFNETPNNVPDIHAELSRLDPDIVKLVTMATLPTDMVRVLQLVDAAQVPTVGFCMGELGMPSRILCAKYGAPFTYAAAGDQREVAPGQLSLDAMRDVYRFDEINSQTQVFAVLGDPIGHSLSPQIHNAALKHEGLNAVYVPLRIPADVFSETLDAYEWLDFRGYSVTIPHKQAVMAKAAHCDQPVKDIGAANTLYRDEEGNWQATNTDYSAALESVQLGLQRLHGDTSLQGRRVLMLGAGGVARAIGLAVLREGAELTIANRTHEKAVKLVKELVMKCTIDLSSGVAGVEPRGTSGEPPEADHSGGSLHATHPGTQSSACREVPWEDRGNVQTNIVINCTAVGMHPNVDATPLAAEHLAKEMLVFDTIYNPEQTLLLKQARDRGCETVDGLEMFVRQAARQFELFTNRPAPFDLMRETVRRGISSVS